MGSNREEDRPAHRPSADALPCGEEWCRAVLDGLSVAIYTTDAAGRITYYNAAAVELAGRVPVLGRDEWCVSWRLYAMDGTPMRHDECPMAVALREDRPVRGVEAILERPDGTRVTFAPYPTPLHDASGALVGAVNLLLDVTDRKLKESADSYLAAIVDSTEDAVISKNLDAIITSWNAGAEALFGYRADEAIGQPITMLFPPDRLGEEDTILSQIRRGRRVDHFDTVRRRKDGSDIDVSVTISPVRDASGRMIGISKIARDIRIRKGHEAALRNFNDVLERRVSERTRELYEANERLVTEASERTRAEEALHQAQKLEAVGQLAAGMAHDFNNLLTSILGNLEMLDARIADERMHKMVQAAARSVQRGALLNDQILAFSRKQHLAPKSVDLNALIVEVEDMLRRTFGGTIELTTDLEPNLWPVLVDPHQLELVILNLAINARDAMPRGGRIRMDTRNVAAQALDRATELAPGDYLRLSVVDTGIGMSEEVLRRACEPFYTTKAVGKGSGLGLSQAYGVARQSGGCLQIESAVGKGTTVELYLPRSTTQADALAASRRGRPHSGSAGTAATVLVVDDHEDVREVAAAQLEMLGHRVVQAANGALALDILDDGNAIDLLMVDYGMPGLSGIELARAVRRKHPHMPVLVFTGYADTTRVEGQIPFARLIKKPYRMSDLAEAVGELLRPRTRHRTAANIIALNGGNA